jgi:hydrogenase-4 transcriptional activator
VILPAQDEYRSCTTRKTLQSCKGHYSVEQGLCQFPFEPPEPRHALIRTDLAKKPVDEGGKYDIKSVIFKGSLCYITGAGDKMEKFMPLLLNVWREACRHIEIAESVARMASVLMQRLAVELVLVRRLDLQRSCLETVATGLPRSTPAPSPIRTNCGPEDIERILSWCHQGNVIRGHARDVRGRLPGLVPSGVEGNLVVGPLNSAAEPIGVLILITLPPRSFRVEHEAMLRALLEPFTIALENDQRVHELIKLREAAEADRHALLTRLGRQNIIDTIIGADSGLRYVMGRVELVARTDLPVLIFGETGSGKEVIARAIHSRSERSPGPFLRVNCGAIPPDLIDSELFGHERGSFTGAINMRKGWFERADGGTLFMDEIGELPLAAQVRLLRVLQDGLFERVGGQQQLHVDVRIIAATNRDLRATVGKGLFREDLWYRIAVFPIDLPPLRDRLEDMPAMAAHFAQRAARRFGLSPHVPTPEDINLLVSYHWPGNVRELAAVIDRAAILGNGRCLEIAKALGFDTQAVPLKASPPLQSIVHPEAPTPFVTLDAATARHVEAALRQTNGRIEGPYGAAQLLGINPHTLRARMRKLRIDWKSYRPKRS